MTVRACAGAPDDRRAAFAAWSVSDFNGPALARAANPITEAPACHGFGPIWCILSVMGRLGGIALLLAAFALPARAGLDDGIKAYYRGEFGAALTEIRPLAQAGNARAQLALALMYERGQGVDRDYLEAMHWYLAAAALGQARALNRIGYLFEMGLGVATDHVEAAHWYREAAIRGDAIAQYSLAHLYARGRGVAQSDAEAAMWYARSAEGGYAYAQASLAWALENVICLYRDMTSAKGW